MLASDQSLVLLMQLSRYLIPRLPSHHVSSEPTTAVVIGVSAKTVSGFTLAGAATVRCRVNLVV